MADTEQCRVVPARSMTPTSFYQYHPLDYSNREIRLVRLRSTKVLPMPRCEIVTFSLDGVPPYVAVSYKWDEPDAPKAYIELNGREHIVHKTVHDFLKSFRNAPHQIDDPAAITQVWLWIDQICIDQADTAEKNNQVPLMSAIYSSCLYVVSWIPSDFSGWSNLHKSKYWTRLWVIQEIIIPPKAYILCNNDWVQWIDIRGKFTWTDISRNELMDIPSQLSAIAQERQRNSGMYSEYLYGGATVMLMFERLYQEQYGKHEASPLDFCLHKYSSQSCKDPRDMVYGLLGLATDQSLPVVDYNKSVIQVFVDTLQCLHHNYWHARSSEKRVSRGVLAKNVHGVCKGLSTGMKITFYDAEEREVVCNAITSCERSQIFFDNLSTYLEERKTESRSGRSLTRRKNLIRSLNRKESHGELPLH